MRLTKQRQEILKIIREHDRHPTVEDVFELARGEFPNISMGTVYRNLNILADSGAIRRIQFPNEPMRFDRVLMSHDHMVCVKCGQITDISSVEWNAEKLIPCDAKVLHHVLFVYCVCLDCQKDFKNLS